MENIFQATQCLSSEEIKHYVKGEITGDLRFKIENHLLDCPLCAEAIEGLSQSEAEIDPVMDDLFESIDQRLQQGSSQSQTKQWWLTFNRIAASLVLVLVCGAAFLFFQHNQKHDAYQAYFQGQNENLATRSIGTEDFPKALEEGRLFFEKEEFERSSAFFESYLELNPESSIAAFYAGLSAVKTGALGKAESWFKTVRMNNENLYEVATWQLIGVYISQRNMDKAKGLLEDLVKADNGIYTEKAKQVLQSLEK